MKPKLSQEHLRSILNYDPATGRFTWKVAHPGPAQQKECAGNLTKFGYVRITIEGCRYMAHLLAWCWMTGEWIARGVDHRDTNRSNNAWSNLRRATQSQQNMNSKVKTTNKSGRKGVCLRPGRRPYAQIGIPGIGCVYLGSFDTIEAAAERYAEVARKCHGEFARTE